MSRRANPELVRVGQSKERDSTRDADVEPGTAFQTLRQEMKEVVRGAGPESSAADSARPEARSLSSGLLREKRRASLRRAGTIRL